METITKPLVKLEKSKRRIYKTSDGVKVPGVTTVLACVAKNQLIQWAAKEERDGIIKLLRDGIGRLFDDSDPLTEDELFNLIPEKYFYETKRDTAASVGTICHFMCECYLKNQEPDLSEFPKEQVSLAENGFIKFLEFWEKSGFEVTHTEHMVVHNQLGFGGTLDVICKNKEGENVLLDIKTSKAIYESMWSQVAAYSELLGGRYLEPKQKDPFFKHHMIVRIGKEEIGDLQIVENNDLKPYMDLFMGALQVYNAQKDIKAIS